MGDHAESAIWWHVGPEIRITLSDWRWLSPGAQVTAVRPGRWLVDDLQMGRADLVVLGRSLHDRTGRVSVPLCLRSSYAAGPWAGSVR